MFKWKLTEYLKTNQHTQDNKVTILFLKTFSVEEKRTNQQNEDNTAGATFVYLFVWPLLIFSKCFATAMSSKTLRIDELRTANPRETAKIRSATWSAAVLSRVDLWRHCVYRSWGRPRFNYQQVISCKHHLHYQSKSTEIYISIQAISFITILAPLIRVVFVSWVLYDINILELVLMNWGCFVGLRTHLFIRLSCSINLFNLFPDKIICWSTVSSFM